MKRTKVTKDPKLSVMFANVAFGTNISLLQTLPSNVASGPIEWKV